MHHSMVKEVSLKPFVYTVRQFELAFFVTGPVHDAVMFLRAVLCTRLLMSDNVFRASANVS